MFDDIPISWAPKTLYGCNELSPSDTMFELFGNIWKHLETSYSHSWRHHVTWGLCGWAAWRWFCWPLASSRPEWLQPWWTYCKSLERFESLVGSSRFKIFLRSIMMIKIKHDQTWSNNIKLFDFSGRFNRNQCRMSPVPVTSRQVTRQTRRAALSAGRLTIPKAMAYFAGKPRKPSQLSSRGDHWWRPLVTTVHIMPMIITSEF